MKRILSFIPLMLLLGLLSTSTAYAATSEVTPTFTYGESLTAQQLNQTRQALGVTRGAKEILIHINELNQILHDTYPYNQVYSSTFIEPGNYNGGVKVDIVTPQTITTITPLQYENAALTAGATNVHIRVGSAVAVDGSGALAGVYKAFADAGQALNAEAVKTAQDELEVTGQITKDNKQKSGYSDEALNAALADMKAQIQELKQSNNTITIDQINIIVNQVINNYGLDGYLTQENIQHLSQLMEKFSQIELTNEQKQAIANLGQDIVNNSKDLIQQAQNKWDNLDPNKKEEISQQATSLWEQIKAFFMNLFASL